MDGRSRVLRMLAARITTTSGSSRRHATGLDDLPLVMRVSKVAGRDVDTRNGKVDEKQEQTEQNRTRRFVVGV
jgi:hypothetical protein